jgi:hypothetical protein
MFVKLGSKKMYIIVFTVNYLNKIKLKGEKYAKTKNTTKFISYAISFILMVSLILAGSTMTANAAPDFEIKLYLSDEFKDAKTP